MARPFALILGLLFFAAPALAESWALDPGDSRIGFSIVQIGEVRVEGQIQEFDAEICFDERDLEATTANFRFDLTSLTTGVRERDEILHAREWLASGAHPGGAFDLTSLIRLGPNSFEAEGMLSLKGVEKPVSFPLTLSLLEEKAKGALTIDRRDFNIGEGPWGETEKWAGFPITISFELFARPDGQPCHER